MYVIRLNFRLHANKFVSDDAAKANKSTTLVVIVTCLGDTKDTLISNTYSVFVFFLYKIYTFID